jgi:hypothetical protein
VAERKLYCCCKHDMCVQIRRLGLKRRSRKEDRTRRSAQSEPGSRAGPASRNDGPSRASRHHGWRRGARRTRAEPVGGGHRTASTMRLLSRRLFVEPKQSKLALVHAAPAERCHMCLAHLCWCRTARLHCYRGLGLLEGTRNR